MSEKRRRELLRERGRIVRAAHRAHPGGTVDSDPDRLDEVLRELEKLDARSGRGRPRVDFAAERARLARIEAEERGGLLAREWERSPRRARRPAGFRSMAERREAQARLEAEIRREGRPPARCSPPSVGRRGGVSSPAAEAALSPPLRAPGW